jgi:uncharacterized membrane-anchored protein YhcB (DUF1043 family)
VYGLEWLIVAALLGVAAGAGAGVALAARRSETAVGRARELEGQLTSARAELRQYRQEAVAQFTETARKFQSLNDAYTDLHRQLAMSSSILCGDISGPLLEPPLGHQSLLAPDPRTSAAPDAAPQPLTEAAPPAQPAPDSEPSPALRPADAAHREG